MSQKIENQLNLALDATEAERQRSRSLNVGYDEEENEWELILKYSGSLELVRELAVYVTELTGGYAIIQIKESRIEELAALPEVEFIEKPKNLEEQAISLVGRDIYERLIKGYTEKQWGRECRDLPAFIIKRLPVRFTFDNNYFNAYYQGIPIGGYSKMIKNMLDGIKIKLGKNYLANKEKCNILAKKIVYTGSIDAFFDYKLGTLEYRSIRFENQILDKQNFQGNAVVNYTDRET